MSLPKDLVFHTLKGVKGWSGFFCQRIDVARVTDMMFHKRLFKLMNRDCDYTLRIDYYKPEENLTVAPTFVRGKVGFTLVNTVELSQLLTLRYKTEGDVQNEMDEIRDKQKKLKESVKEFVKNIEKE
jgi:hypothetical protein